MTARGVGVLQSETPPGKRGALRTYFDTEPQGKYVLGIVHDPDGSASHPIGGADVELLWNYREKK